MLVLTGATGFLGSHYLAAYLARHPQERAIALGRDAPHRARARLQAALSATGQPVDRTHLQRVKPMQINIEDPLLGLDGRVYAALAERATTLCHFAGHIGLDASVEVLHTVNVTGTDHLLRLARAAGPRLKFVHISTAYVAGRRRTGTAPEATVRPPGGFLTPYEESKYEAELLVHHYATGTGRSALIARPSLLVTNRPGLSEAPRSPLHRLGAAAASIRRLADCAAERGQLGPGHPATARLPGSSHATLNLLQVEYAARALVHLTDCADTRSGSAEVVHLVHPHEVAVPVLLDALLCHLPGLRLTLSPRIADPTPLEKLLQHMSQGACLYMNLNRQYARSHYLEHLHHLPAPSILTPAYLTDAFATPSPAAHQPLSPGHAPAAEALR